jgi:hypothetical protein
MALQREALSSFPFKRKYLASQFFGFSLSFDRMAFLLLPERKLSEIYDTAQRFTPETAGGRFWSYVLFLFNGGPFCRSCDN